MAKIRSTIEQFCIGAIKIYRYCFSTLFGPNCRFYPSCSKYTQTALETHGLYKGILLGAGRILRCHPWHCGGYDPVPPADIKQIKQIKQIKTSEVE